HPGADRGRRFRPDRRAGARPGRGGSGRTGRRGEPVMDFAFDETTERLQAEMHAFMAEHVYPAEAVYAEQVAAAADPWARVAVIEDLKAEARRRGLWNLFLPGEHGAGLTPLQYAPLAEITGRSPTLAPE